jgi:long-chain-fatty-acid--CoA ligase ACSBG
MSDLRFFDKIDDNCIKSAGRPIDGTQILIFNPDKHSEGEICFRGRNRFMGYYKNE